MPSDDRDYLAKYRYLMAAWAKRAKRHYHRLALSMTCARFYTNFVAGDVKDFNRAGREMFEILGDITDLEQDIAEATYKEDMSRIYTTKIVLELQTKDYFDSLLVFKRKDLKLKCWVALTEMERHGMSKREIIRKVAKES